jgi:hypothetical protein
LNIEDSILILNKDYSNRVRKTKSLIKKEKLKIHTYVYYTIIYNETYNNSNKFLKKNMKYI